MEIGRCLCLSIRKRISPKKRALWTVFFDPEGTNTDWTFYYYGRNLQGDVIALYLYTTGTLVAEYDYDP